MTTAPCKFGRRTCFSYLLPLCLLAQSAHALPKLSEFMADNVSTLSDEDGAFSDWIEIANPDASPVSLSGYHLTDDAANLTKWSFPAVTIPANGYLVVFASNKNRTDPASELHTNFRLSASGEYLGLVAPDGTTVVNDFAPVFPPQFPNKSFGLGVAGASSTVNLAPLWNSPDNYATLSLNGVQSATSSGTPDNLDVSFGGSPVLYYTWYDFGSRLGQITGGSQIASATLTTSGKVIASIFGSAGVTSQLGVFPCPDANKGINTVGATFTANSLIDFYAAHTPVSEFSAVPGESPVVNWNVQSLVQSWIDNPGMAQRGQIIVLNKNHPMYMDWDVSGTGKPLMSLNVTTVSDPGAPAPIVYFDAATPGTGNGGGSAAGPIFGEVTENPPTPVTGPLTITAHAFGSQSPVANVRLYYRRMFGAEANVAMIDDGTGADAVAGDGIYSALIPANQIVPGEMTRWRFVATDGNGVETREPAFRDPLDSHQYFGTVGNDPAIQSKLGVLHWFIQSPTSAEGTAGGRGALYYLGQFYDNVYFNRHGQSTGGFIKKSFNIDFNKTQRFQYEPGGPRVADIDLLTNWADKSKVRHPIAYEIMRESGVHAHFAFTVRVEQNGDFYSTADFVEDGDDRYLKRTGLNPNGSLYKMYAFAMNPGDSVQSPAVEKKNGDPNDRSDLQALVNGMALTGTALTNYLYDNIDIPKTVNMVAANCVIRNSDIHSKNWYAYRDTGKTNEWALLPWDLDLSGGRVWNSTDNYFDNGLTTVGYVQTGGSIRLISHLFGIAETRDMVYRRIRTLSDRFLQEPATPLAERWFERRLDEQSALIDPVDIVPSDAQRDFVKWGSWLQGNGSSVSYTNPNPAVESMAEAILRWKTEYLPGRREEIYNRQTIGKGGQIPLPQTEQSTFTYTPLLQAGAPCSAIVPTDNSLGVNWIGIPAFEPYNTAGWLQGTTGVGYERGSGYQTLIGLNVNTQMMSNNSVYIRVPFTVTNPAAFDTLELRMQVDDGFVAFLNGDILASTNAPGAVTWNSAAAGVGPEADANSFAIFDVTSKRSSLRAGLNILAIQGLNESTGSSDMIIRPELYGGVLNQAGGGAQPVLQFGAIEFSPASGNQDEEFIEINNPNGIAVDVSDWRITGGVEFTFQPGTVIPPGKRVYVSPDVTVFRARATSPKGGESRFVQGPYKGHLSSLGETLTLLDADGAMNAETSYVGNPSDVQRYLVITEVMYHPAGDEFAEFIELMNISGSVTLNLAGVHFTDGIDFDFTGSAITSLAPGQRVLVVRNMASFEAAHGAGLPVAGIFANLTALSNSGELIKLEDGLNGTISEFTYNDKAPWPVDADGSGHSMVLIGAGSGPNPDRAVAWRASATAGGNPNTTDVVAPPSAPLGDANANGVPDLVDYALGNGLGTAPIPLALTMETHDIGGEMQRLPTLTYPISIGAEAAITAVEWSTDAETWAGEDGVIERVSTLLLGDGRGLVTVRVLRPTADASRLLLRVSASQ